MVYRFLFFSCLIFFFSCNKDDSSKSHCIKCFNSSNDTETVQIDVDLKSIELNYWYDSIFTDVQYIPLESNTNSLFGNISKIIHANNLFFIGDFRTTKAIYIFNDQGKFINKIMSIGKGALEYQKITDFAVDTTTQLVTVLASNDKKIIRFNFDGKAIDETKLNYATSSIQPYSDGYFFYANVKKEGKSSFSHLLLQSDENYKLKRSFLKFRYECIQYRIGKSNFFSTYNNKMLLNPVYSNNIYHYQNDSLKVKYSFNFGQSTMLEDEIFNLKTKEVSVYREENNKVLIDKFLETDDYLFVTFLWGKKFVKYIYNKKSPKESILFHVMGSKKKPPMSFNKFYKGETDNTVIGLVETLSYIRAKSYLEEPLMSDFGYEVKPSDNPILVISKLVKQ